MQTKIAPTTFNVVFIPASSSGLQNEKFYAKPGITEHSHSAIVR
jgi:hypothetical protein